MINLGARSKVRGFGHIFLQILRIFTIIALFALTAANWSMIVISGLRNHFSFFDTMSHVFASAVAVCLIISELDMFRMFRQYFERNWPALSPSHSLAWLGLAMVVLGCEVIGDQGMDAYSQKNMGLPLWRLVLASGILSITFGFANMLASAIFRDSNNGITARRIRSDGNLAVAPSTPKEEMYDDYSQRSASLRHNQSRRHHHHRHHRHHGSSNNSSSGSNGGSNHSHHNDDDDREGISAAARRVTRLFNVKNIRRSKIQISKPIIHEPIDVERGAADDYSDDRTSPIVPNIQRPPTALHPAYTGGSRYSEAHMSRF